MKSTLTISALAFAFSTLLMQTAFAESCQYSQVSSDFAEDAGYVLLNFTPDNANHLDRDLKIPARLLPLKEGQISSWVQGSGNPLGEDSIYDAKSFQTLTYTNSTLTITTTAPLEFRVYTLATDANLNQVSSYKEVYYVFGMPQTELECDRIQRSRY